MDEMHRAREGPMGMRHRASMSSLGTRKLSKPIIWGLKKFTISD